MLEVSPNSYPIKKYSFTDKLNYDAQTSLFVKRDEAKINLKKFKPILTKIKENIWERDTIVDFNPSVYHPKPPKRNSKESMKPWSYDKYLKPIEKVNTISADDHIKNRLAKVELFDELSLSSFYLNNDEKKAEFQASFRSLSPNEDRFKTAKYNCFRELIGEYKNPKPHDFRGLKPLIGMDDLKLRFYTHDKNKFLSQNLTTIHGDLNTALHLRDIDNGLQMGDLVKKQEPKFDSKLILPKLSYPNRFYGYSRHRPKVRSVESAFWDHVLPKLNEKWNNEKLLKQSL